MKRSATYPSVVLSSSEIPVVGGASSTLGSLSFSVSLETLSTKDAPGKDVVVQTVTPAWEADKEIIERVPLAYYCKKLLCNDATRDVNPAWGEEKAGKSDAKEEELRRIIGLTPELFRNLADDMRTHLGAFMQPVFDANRNLIRVNYKPFSTLKLGLNQEGAVIRVLEKVNAVKTEEYYPLFPENVDDEVVKVGFDPTKKYIIQLKSYDNCEYYNTWPVGYKNLLNIAYDLQNTLSAMVQRGFQGSKAWILTSNSAYLNQPRKMDEKTGAVRPEDQSVTVQVRDMLSQKDAKSPFQNFVIGFSGDVEHALEDLTAKFDLPAYISLVDYYNKVILVEEGLPESRLSWNTQGGGLNTEKQKSELATYFGVTVPRFSETVFGPYNRLIRFSNNFGDIGLSAKPTIYDPTSPLENMQVYEAQLRMGAMSSEEIRQALHPGWKALKKEENMAMQQQQAKDSKNDTKK